MKKSRLIGLVVVVALAAVWAGLETGRRTRPPAEFAPPAPNSSEAITQLLATPLKTASGETKNLNAWAGKILVVNFWATWCPPCREEMPEFSRVQDQYAGNGVQFAGIAIDEASNVVEFSKKIKVSYPLLVGSPDVLGLTARLGNLQQGLPFTLIIGRDGKLVATHLGRLSEADLIKSLTPLIQP